jgi:hypothetical protein
LSCRSPVRLRRCSCRRPEEVSSGLVPASLAKAASLWIRPGWDQAVRMMAALTGPTPVRLKQGGCGGGDVGQGVFVVAYFGVEGEDSGGESDCFGSCDGLDEGVVFTGAPGGDDADGGPVDFVAGINVEVVDPQECVEVSRVKLLGRLVVRA